MGEARSRQRLTCPTEGPQPPRPRALCHAPVRHHGDVPGRPVTYRATAAGRSGPDLEPSSERPSSTARPFFCATRIPAPRPPEKNLSPGRPARMRFLRRPGNRFNRRPRAGAPGCSPWEHRTDPGPADHRCPPSGSRGAPHSSPPPGHGCQQGRGQYQGDDAHSCRDHPPRPRPVATPTARGGPVASLTGRGSSRQTPSYEVRRIDPGFWTFWTPLRGRAPASQFVQTGSNWSRLIPVRCRAIRDAVTGR